VPVAHPQPGATRLAEGAGSPQARRRKEQAGPSVARDSQRLDLDPEAEGGLRGDDDPIVARKKGFELDLDEVFELWLSLLLEAVSRRAPA